MLLRRFTDYVLHNRLQAMLAAFLLAFIPLIGAGASILVAALVTLRKGAFEGTLVLIASLVPFVVSYAISEPAAGGQLLIAMETLIAINILTWLLALVLRRYANWSLVIEVAALAGMILVGSVHLLFPDIQAWWGTQLTASFSKAAVVLGQLSDDPSASKAMTADLVANLQRYVTGFVVVSVMFNALLQLILARWWQAVIFNPGELRKELHQIRLSYVSVLVFAAVGMLGYLGSNLCLDFLPVLIAAFCAAGLSLIHRLVISNRAGWFWLSIVYFSIMFVVPLGIVLVAIVGLFDSLLDVRKQLGK
jgi:hypothetical protein